MLDGEDVPSEPKDVSSPSSENAPHELESSTPGSDSPFAAAPTSRNPFADSAATASDNPFATDAGNPYAAPTSGAGMVSQGRFGLATEHWARTCVAGPANFLAAVSGLVLILNATGFVINLTSLIVDGSFENSVYTAIGTVVVVVPYGIVLYGALRMKQLKNYNLAIAVSIMAMLPCSGCCILGLPVGIWSLVVLRDSNIRAAFH